MHPVCSIRAGVLPGRIGDQHSRLCVGAFPRFTRQTLVYRSAAASLVERRLLPVRTEDRYEPGET